MNREKVKELLPVITAYANGEVIQYRSTNIHPWEDSNHFSFSSSVDCYRIKPKETVRPFANGEEFLAAWDGRMLKTTANDAYRAVTSVITTTNELVIAGGFYSPKLLLETFTFFDGSPCGITETK